MRHYNWYKVSQYLLLNHCEHNAQVQNQSFIRRHSVTSLQENKALKVNQELHKLTLHSWTKQVPWNNMKVNHAHIFCYSKQTTASEKGTQFVSKLRTDFNHNNTSPVQNCSITTLHYCERTWEWSQKVFSEFSYASLPISSYCYKWQ